MAQSKIYVYAFNPVVAIPSTTYLWKIKKIIRDGNIDAVPMAKIAPQSVWLGSANWRMARDTVKF